MHKTSSTPSQGSNPVAAHQFPMDPAVKTIDQLVVGRDLKGKGAHPNHQKQVEGVFIGQRTLGAVSKQPGSCDDFCEHKRNHNKTCQCRVLLMKLSVALRVCIGH